MTEAHTDAIERALWIAIRTLRKRIVIHQRLATVEDMEGRKDIAERFRGTVNPAAHDVALLPENMERL